MSERWARTPRRLWCLNVAAAEATEDTALREREGVALRFGAIEQELTLTRQPLLEPQLTNDAEAAGE